MGKGRGASGIEDPPDGGCIAMVLRTGFASSQGELIQLIEFSQQAVSADSKEVRRLQLWYHAHRKLTLETLRVLL